MMSVVVAFAFSLVACTENPQEQQPDPSFLTLESDTLWVAAVGTEMPEQIAVYASSDKWSFSSEEEWLTIEQSFGDVCDYLNISVDENTEETTRQANVLVYYQELTAELVVMQVADTHVEATRIIPADTLYQASGDGGVLPISVIADGEYTVTTDAGWLSYDGQEQTTTGIVENIYISKSYDKLPRYGVVTFASEQTTTSVRVMQWGSQVLFVDNTEELSFAFMKATPQAITIKANGEWTPSCDAEWVNWEIKSGVVTDTLFVSVEDNAVAEARNATLTIACGSESVEIGVSQEAMKEFGDVANMEFPADIQVPIKSVEASSRWSTSYVANKAIDNDASTYWQADYGIDKAPWFAINLDPASYEQIDYCLYTPYAPYSSTNGPWGEVEIYVTDSEGNETQYATIDVGQKMTPTAIKFETPLKNVKRIRFQVLSSKNNSSNKERLYANIQEIALFKSNTIGGDPLSVFTDWSLSELRSDVTLEKIEALAADVYRTIAEQLYYGVYDGEFRICKFKAFPHPDVDAKIFRTNTYTLLDNVTGMYVAEAGDTVHVYLNDIKDLAVSLRVIDWETMESASASTSTSSYLSVNGKYQYVYHTYTLKEGHNAIVPQVRGLMYIMCHTDNYENYPEMTAHFVTGEVNGYIELGKTDMSRAYELLRKGGNTEPHFDMMSHRALLNFPKSLYYSNTFKKNSANFNRVEELLHIFDTVMYIQEDIQGHYKYKAQGLQRVHRNRSLFHATYTSYYGASSSYRTYYNVNSMAPGIVDPTDQWKKNVTHYSNDVVGSIWGLAHELGHTNQTDLFKWRGLTEVTNNLMCAITQMIFYGEGNTTMRFNDHFNRSMIDIATRVIWDFDDEGNYYERPLTHCESVNTPCYRNFSEGTDPTSQLMPFWQLYLYYHVALGKTDFYPDFYELCRTKDIQSANYASTDLYHSAMTLEYMKSISEAAGEDLSDFAQAWGLPGVNSPKGVNKGTKVNHYGQNFIITSAEEVAASVAACQKFPKPKMNPFYIHDLNIDLYRNPQPVTAGTHSVDDNGNFTVSGWQNVVAWVLVDPNKKDLRTGEQGRVIAVKKWDEALNGGFQYGYRESRYMPIAEGNYTDYYYTDGTSSKAGTSRALQAVTTDYEYAKGLQLYAVDAYGTRYASQSNAQ